MKREMNGKKLKTDMMAIWDKMSDSIAAFQNATRNPMAMMNPMLLWVELAKQWQKHWAEAFGANAPDFAAAFQNATRNPMNPMQFWIQAAAEWEKHGADAITRWDKLPDFLDR